ncbi:MAG: metallophosphoesterase [Oscillospiraceae bacterium]|nr:metallophosphoesterase [Oscillospiraceae bacterium]
MSLYAIGDLHLSLGSDKPMDVFGGGWSNYIEKIKAGFSHLESEDVCVLCGDTSWGMSLEESLEDFCFLNQLPGRKIILKGNHDYWWGTATKLRSFFEQNGIDNIDILHNNSFVYEGTAICGTRGWLIDSESDAEQNSKIMAREVSRLRMSLESADDALDKFCFFHYPPRFKNMVCQDIIDVMNEHCVKNCWYGHIHGSGHRFAVQGEAEGIFYEMVSADFAGFAPKKII